eukprot:PhF_6_TR37576/c0_g1_i4/m.55726
MLFLFAYLLPSFLCIFAQDSVPTTATPTLSSSSLQYVVCSSRLRCSTDVPICCGRDEGYEEPYCARGGSYCCDAEGGRSFGGCMIGTTCCISNTSSKKSCCGPNTVCSATGECIANMCSLAQTEESCKKLPSACKWCCSGQCLSLRYFDTGCQVSDNECKLGCAQKGGSCGECTADPACSWCCSTGKCEHRSIAKCGKYSTLTTSMNCSACDKRGTGLYTERYDNTDPDVDDLEYGAMTFSLYVAAMVVSVVLIGMSLRLLRHYLFRRMLTRQAQQMRFTGVVSSSPTGAFHYDPVPKVRFFDLSEPLPEDIAATFPSSEEAEGGDNNVTVEESCVICLDAAAQVMFLPCKHVCCCCQCSFQWEDTYVASESARHNSGTTIARRGPPPPPPAPSPSPARSDAAESTAINGSGTSTTTQNAIDDGRKGLRCPLCRVNISYMIRWK